VIRRTLGRDTAGRVRRASAVVAAAVCLALGSSSLPAAADLTPPPEPLLDGPPPATWPATPEVDVPTALLVEAATGQVLGAAGPIEERREVASTVKILTALSAAERVPFDEVVTVGDEVEVAGASVSLGPGDTWTVEQLLVGLLVRSGNDAAEAIAAHVGGDRDGFVAAMTEDAAALGLPTGPDGVELASPSGLDDENRLSAADLALLARAALAHPDLRPVFALPEVALPGIGTDENRNLLIGSYPGATGVKTGFTQAAGNSLVGSAVRDGRELVVVVLGGGADPERFDDARTLLDHGFDTFERRELTASRTLLVAGGARTISTADTVVSVPTGATATVELPLPTRVPEPGTGTASVVVDGDHLATVTTEVAAEDPPPVSGGGAVGRGVVDGVHAALRAARGTGLATPAGSEVGSR
jgi:serine-type D-Ala-D-Ala carboxypeptidase (penicillin-binding protein 5/6)